MKMDKDTILSKTYFIVSEGFEVIPFGSYEFVKVTDYRAVMVKDNIFCSLPWFNSLKTQTGLDLNANYVKAEL